MGGICSTVCRPRRVVNHESIGSRMHGARCVVPAWRHHRTLREITDKEGCLTARAFLAPCRRRLLRGDTIFALGLLHIVGGGLITTGISCDACFVHHRLFCG